MIRRIRLAGALLLPLGVVACGALGCRAPRAALELTSFKDPYFPEQYRLELDECTYQFEGDNDVHIAGRAGPGSSDVDGEAVEQMLHIHVFWRPRPAKTFDNSTSIDATIRYAIVTPRGAAVYQGTGYVYLRRKQFSEKLVVSVESARLRLESRIGDAPTLLGDTRVVGELTAGRDDAGTLHVAREIERTAALTDWVQAAD